MKKDALGVLQGPRISVKRRYGYYHVTKPIMILVYNRKQLHKGSTGMMKGEEFPHYKYRPRVPWCFIQAKRENSSCTELRYCKLWLYTYSYDARPRVIVLSLCCGLLAVP